MASCRQGPTAVESPQVPPKHSGGRAGETRCAQRFRSSRVLTWQLCGTGRKARQGRSSPGPVLHVISSSSPQHSHPTIGWWVHTSYPARGFETPNIDRIGKEGAMFMSWYAQQSCTAGRAAFDHGTVASIRTGLTKARPARSRCRHSEGRPNGGRGPQEHRIRHRTVRENHLGDRPDRPSMGGALMEPPAVGCRREYPRLESCGLARYSRCPLNVPGALTHRDRCQPEMRQPRPSFNGGGTSGWQQTSRGFQRASG